MATSKFVYASPSSDESDDNSDLTICSVKSPKQEKTVMVIEDGKVVEAEGAKKRKRNSSDETLSYPTAASLGDGMGSPKVRKNLEIGQFAIKNNGEVQMCISSGKRLTISTYRQNVYVHLFADSWKKDIGGKHYSLTGDEIDVLIDNIALVQRHVKYQRKVLKKCLEKKSNE